MTQPISAEPGQPFGVAGQQRESQRTLPLPSLDAPTARPGEPVTTGLSTGPGAGPEVLGAPPAEAASNERLRMASPGLTRLASLPGVHPDIRSLARRVRAASRLRQ